MKALGYTFGGAAISAYVILMLGSGAFLLAQGWGSDVFTFSLGFFNIAFGLVASYMTGKDLFE